MSDLTTTYESILEDLHVIRDERNMHANTAERIGTAMIELLQFAKAGIDALSGTIEGLDFDTYWEEYIDEDTGEHSVHLKDQYAGAWANGSISSLGLSPLGSPLGLNEPLLSINSAVLDPHPSASGQTIVWDGSSWVYGAAGGTDLGAVWDSLGTADYTKQIDATHLRDALSGYLTEIPTASSSVIGGIKVGETLSISNSVLDLKRAATKGTYRSVTVDDYGRVTAGTNPTTLAGYGIADAYFGAVNNDKRQIRLGSVTQDVLIAHQSLTNYATKSWVNSNAVVDAGGNLSSTDKIYDIVCKRVFSGYNMTDAPDTGWVSGLVLGSNWNNNHYQHYLVESGHRWYTTRKYENGEMADWETFAYLTDNVASATKLQTKRSLWGNDFDGSANVNGLIEAANGVSVPSGKYIKIGSLYLTYDSINNAIRVSANSDGSGVGHFYATGTVSTLGYSANGGGGGVTSLAQLTDVQLGTLANGNVLMYNGSKWVNSSGNFMQKARLDTTANIDTLYDAGSYRFSATAQGTWPTGVTANYGQMLVVRGADDTVAQMFFPYSDTHAYLRVGNPMNANNGSWRSWKKLATTDGNVASATKLQTARSLWGNSFNGTEDINGSITMNNLQGIYIKDTGGTPINCVTLNTANTFALGYGARINNYSTDIQGSVIIFATNNGQTSGEHKIEALRIRGGGLLELHYGAMFNNNNVIGFKDSGGTEKTILRLNNNNQLELGYGSAGSDYLTQIFGGTTTGIKFYQGNTLAAAVEGGDHSLVAYYHIKLTTNNQSLYTRDTSNNPIETIKMSSSNVLYFGSGNTTHDHETRMYGGATDGINFYVGSNNIASIQSKTVDNVLLKGLRIGDGIIMWDSGNNALKVIKSDGSAANLYATGGVSALGFQADVNIPSISSLTVGGRLTVGTGDNYMEYTASSPINDLKIRSTGYISLYANSDASRVYVYSGSLYASNIVEGNTIQATQKVTSPKFYLDSTRYIYLDGTTLKYYNGSQSKTIVLS